MMRFLIFLLKPFVWWFCRLVFKIEFHGVDNIPLEGACIITPNHVTYADPIWITIPMPRRIYYMAWNKPFRIPILGLLMRMFGAFPVNLDVAADASAQREAIEALRKGRALVMFPEGGRTKTGKLMPFKDGGISAGTFSRSSDCASDYQRRRSNLAGRTNAAATREADNHLSPAYRGRAASRGSEPP